MNNTPVDDWIYVSPNRSNTTTSIYQELDNARRWGGFTQEQWDSMYGDPKYANPFMGKWSKAHILILYRREGQLKGIHKDLEYKAHNKRRRRK